MPTPRLITADEVLTASAGHAPRLSDAAFADTCIGTATGVLDQFLGYGALVHVVTADAAPAGYTPAGGFYAYTAGPASLALTSGYTLDARGRLTWAGTGPQATLPTDGEVSYLRGWRPVDDAGEPYADDALLDYLTAAGDITGADGEPITAADLAVVPDPPDEIRQALIEASLAVALRLSAGLVGVRQTTVDLGSGSRTTEGADPDAPRKIIRALCGDWRHVHV